MSKEEIEKEKEAVLKNFVPQKRICHIEITYDMIDRDEKLELAQNILLNLKIVDRPRDADYIVPKVDLDYNWMRSASRNFRKLTRGKLYRKFGEKFVFYKEI